MILETNQMIIYETGSASRKSEIAELKEVHFEGSVDFKVTVEDSVNLEHTYLCHLVKDNLKWLLGIEINEFMECEDESYFVNSLQVELDNLHETQKNSQKIYKKLPCEKSACSISYALKYFISTPNGYSKLSIHFFMMGFHI